MMDEKSDDLMISILNLLLFNHLHPHRVLIKLLAKRETYHLLSRFALPALLSLLFIGKILLISI